MKYYISQKTDSYRQLAHGDAPKGFKEVSKGVFENFVEEIEDKKERIRQGFIEEKDEKLVGIEFNGVKCSATRKDQDGLTSVFLGINSGFIEKTNFKFSNGSTLEITSENLEEFAIAWTQYRQSFFK